MENDPAELLILPEFKIITPDSDLPLHIKFARCDLIKMQRDTSAQIIQNR